MYFRNEGPIIHWLPGWIDFKLFLRQWDSNIKRQLCSVHITLSLSTTHQTTANHHTAPYIHKINVKTYSNKKEEKGLLLLSTETTLSQSQLAFLSQVRMYYQYANPIMRRSQTQTHNKEIIFTADKQYFKTRQHFN